MAYDKKTAERVRRALGGQPGIVEQNVVEQKMMGGLIFMIGGRMCCGVSGTALMVRVGRDAYQRMLTQPHVRPMELAGRRPTGFVLIDPKGFRTGSALARWVQRGIDFASTLRVKKPAAKTPRRKTVRS
jgi:TfoX/Sxy family transcriptional regulator of competence genes